jgi:hypothetical protein
VHTESSTGGGGVYLALVGTAGVTSSQVLVSDIITTGNVMHAGDGAGMLVSTVGAAVSLVNVELTNVVSSNNTGVGGAAAHGRYKLHPLINAVPSRDGRVYGMLCRLRKHACPFVLYVSVLRVHKHQWCRGHRQHGRRSWRYSQ